MSAPISLSEHYVKRARVSLDRLAAAVSAVDRGEVDAARDALDASRELAAQAAGIRTALQHLGIE